MSVRILIGDVRDNLRELPADSVHCVVTSPPYWGLRDYGVDGQIGLEPTLGEHLAVMVDVFREVRRVMRPDATLWLNYGDCYNAQAGQRKTTDKCGPKQASNAGANSTGSRFDGSLKPKDLCMVPNRLAIALQEDGWWVRSEIIWHKPNPMPESITDRPTSSHEKLWLLSKSARYFYDADAVREAMAASSEARLSQDIVGQSGSMRANGGKKTNGPMKAVGSLHMRETSRRDGDRWRAEDGGVAARGERNLRNVWTIPTAAFSEAHFATFPPALVEPCIKAGTSEHGCCADCGASWVRQTDVGYDATDRRPAPNKGRLGAMGERAANMTRDGFIPNREKKVLTTGWAPSCACDAPAVPCTVLDPFGGSGTVGLVADRLGRNALLIELNPEYAAIAERRIRGDLPMFAEVAAE